MFTDRLNRGNHMITTVDDNGQFVNRAVTCAEMADHVGLHTKQVLTPDGNGDATLKYVTVPCAEAEAELYGLRGTNASQAEEIEAQDVEIERLNGEVANYKRLIAGAMQIVFHMGPALQQLLAEMLADPTLTDDGTAVKVEHPLFTILIDPFKERITVRSVTGSVAERTFAVIDGQLSEDVQTLLLGLIDRIRKAESAGGADPVQGKIGLIRAAI